MSDTPNNSKSSQSGSRNNNSRKRRYNNRNKKRNFNNKRDDNKGQVEASSSETKNTNQNRNSNTKKRFNNRNRRPKTLSPIKTNQKYDNLLEQYLIARRKFFDIHGRGKEKQLAKVERNYQLALKNLRDFEKDLKDWQIEALKEKLNAYPEDRQFSKEHDLAPNGDEVSFVGEFEDPHLLPTQKSDTWTNDSEETEGTMEDYERYKNGLVG